MKVRSVSTSHGHGDRRDCFEPNLRLPIRREVTENDRSARRSMPTGLVALGHGRRNSILVQFGHSTCSQQLRSGWGILPLGEQ